MEINNDIINQIKSTLKIRKMNYNDLAQVANIPKSTISKILSGNTSNPRFDTMNAICNALGLPLELPTQPTIIDNDRRVIAIGHGAPREEYELSEEDAAIVRELINRLNQNKK